ncbi:MAG: glutamine amidotransferase [Frankiales bacterium]|nr:glutamine amidotransferase [Frankiales bacterium]
MTVGVLALQGDVREHVHALEAVGATARPVKRLADLSGLDGIVLPGGESTTMGRLLGIFDLLDPLRALLGDGLPAYGTCAGMILLAAEVVDGRPGQELLGGLDITVRRNAFGSQVESFESDLDVEGVGDVHGVFIRAPWVERAGPSVQVLARVGEHPVAVRQGHLMATSFHPELTGDTRMHELFVRRLVATEGGRP